MAPDVDGVADDAPEPDPASTPDDAATHERARMRGPRRVLVWGVPASMLLSFASSAVGADGRAGAFLLLLLLALTFGVAGVWIGVGLLVDDWRDQPTSRRRGLVAGALFVASLVCMTAIGGVAASATV